MEKQPDSNLYDVLTQNVFDLSSGERAVRNLEDFMAVLIEIDREQKFNKPSNEE